MRQYFSNIILPFMLVLLGLLAYLNSFNGVFALDDEAWIVGNNNISSISDYIHGSSRPLTALTVALNYKLSGKIPTDYHAVNLVIHLLAGLFLFGLVRRTLSLPLFYDSAGAKYRDLISFFSAVIWLVHPLQTESVTYIIQRAEELMGLFYLLTMYSFVRGSQSTGKRWFVISVLSCMLGMMSKPIMVTAPFMVLLYDVIFVSRSWRNSLQKHWRVYLWLAASWMILSFLVLQNNESSGTTGLSLKSITPLGYLATQQEVILHYLRLVFLPDVLCLDYGWNAATDFNAVFYPALIIGLLIIATIIFLWKKMPAGYCLAWFFVILAPSSSIIPIADYAVEHRVYLSLAGLTVLIVALIVYGVDKLFANRENASIKVRVLVSVLLLIITAALMVRTIERNDDYADYNKLIEAILSVNPYNFRARTIQINTFMSENKFKDAEQAARKELALIKNYKPGENSGVVSASSPADYYPDANNHIGAALLCQNKNEEAIPFFRAALLAKPDMTIAGYNLAVALHGLGRDDAALREAEKVIQHDKNYAQAYLLIGIIKENSGKLSDAIVAFRKALALDSSLIIAKTELAWILATSDDSSTRDWQASVRLAREVYEQTGGGNYRILDILAAAYAANGDFVLAEKTAEKALALSEQEFSAPNKRNLDEKSSPENIRKRLGAYRKKINATEPDKK